MSIPLYGIFFKDRIIFRPRPSFLPQAASDFCLNQFIQLLIFFVKLYSIPCEARFHTLNMVNTLSFNGTVKSFIPSSGLSMAFTKNQSWGQQAFINSRPTLTQLSPNTGCSYSQTGHCYFPK